MNTVVYSTDVNHPTRQTGMPAALSAPYGKNWQCEQRVSEERHAEACSALRKHYQTKATNYGMSLESYCRRFGVKL
ncbi:hypothetical protein BN109_gp3 [Yersinia phage phi80-18]|uniref:Uncharacterized protein n=1 Tax=Yersinia phage phi80-18 TaxID=1206559 RepID=I7J417_9CAUD|nr:hypothetical protein BN109_gp3 [Yersinia phage phi80-18]CCI88843.2 hypothetical protein [Yersinia phage phi80-18]